MRLPCVDSRKRICNGIKSMYKMLAVWYNAVAKKLFKKAVRVMTGKDVNRSGDVCPGTFVGFGGLSELSAFSGFTGFGESFGAYGDVGLSGIIGEDGGCAHGREGDESVLSDIYDKCEILAPA